jgi:pyruvate formate lyase activating enzyme
MERCWKIAREQGMAYVYVGNVPGTAHLHTVCPKCGKAVVKRSGYEIVEMSLRNGACRFCARKIPGTWT